MGILRTLFLGDLGNYLDIEDTKRDVEYTRDVIRQERSTQSMVDRTQDVRIRTLEDRNQELEATVAALSRLLVRKGVIDEIELATIATSFDEMNRD